MLPLNQESFDTLDSLTAAPDALVHLIKIDPQVKQTKAIVMGYPIRMPVDLLKRHPLVEEATRCVPTRFQWET